MVNGGFEKKTKLLDPIIVDSYKQVVLIGVYT